MRGDPYRPVGRWIISQFDIAREKEQCKTTIWVHRQCMINCQTSVVDVKYIKFKERTLSVGWAGLASDSIILWNIKATCEQMYWHPGSCNSCLWYCKYNLISIYKSLQFDPEVMMIMSSSQIISTWMNLPFSQALHSLQPWRWSCDLLAGTSFLRSCDSFFQFDFWLGSHMVFFVVL